MPNKYNIAIIPGDGIGEEVMNAALKVLKSLKLKKPIELKFLEAGDECLKNTGTALPDETIETIKKSDACLFGAVGETAADVIIKLRQELGLYVNLRPVKSYPGVNALFDDIDFIIVRENSEGLYIANEKEIPDGASATRIITYNGSKRICDWAYNFAKSRNRKQVTCVHKANVLKKTDGVFKKSFYELSKKYPDIKVNDYYVDATAMFFLTRPEMFDVIVTTNLFGDILSDEGAGLVGGLGLMPSANIGDNTGVFEPVHGSAPDIAGQNIANPCAMILSLALMLNHIEEYEMGTLVENAIINVLSKGETLTPDMGGNATTSEITLKIIEEIKNNL